MNRLSGHVNVFFEHNDNDNDDIDESTLPANKLSDGQTAYDYWGGNVYIQSAASGAAAHDEQPGHFVTIQNGNGTTLEGDIEWQANRYGQGRYRVGSLGRVYTGPTDTLYMRGVRSAVFSNVGTWRTMAEDLYRLRTLQHGESTGLWAYVGAGRYAMQGMGVSNESTYTRFQGGYDKSYGHQWIIGGQVDYLRGHDDYINHGFGKDHVFALGAYATKLLGDTTFTIGAMTVHQSPINSVSGKLGVEIGRTIGTGNLYARFDVHHAFTGNVTTQYNHTTTQADIKGTWTDVAVGGRYGINANNSLYENITTGLYGIYKKSWVVNAGFTHRF